MLQKTVTISKVKLSPLLYLLEDDDKEVQQNVSDKLVSYGSEITPDLELAYEKSLESGNEVLEERLWEVMEKINYQVVTELFHHWLKSEEKDLLQAMMLIARHQYRDLKEEWVVETMNEITNSIDFEISRYNPPLQLVSIINRCLYDTYEFNTVDNRENAGRYFALNQVLSSKKGVPTSISLLYLIIAAKLDIPIFGIVWENNLLLGYFKRNTGWKKAIPKLHFYINPNEKGNIFTPTSLMDYLQEMDIPYHPACSVPSSNMQVFRVVLAHLAATYRGAGNAEKVQEVEAWIADLEEVIYNLPKR